MCVFVCELVCVCERERESELGKEGKRERDEREREEKRKVLLSTDSILIMLCNNISVVCLVLYPSLVVCLCLSCYKALVNETLMKVVQTVARFILNICEINGSLELNHNV